MSTIGSSGNLRSPPHSPTEKVQAVGIVFALREEFSTTQGTWSDRAAGWLRRRLPLRVVLRAAGDRRTGRQLEPRRSPERSHSWPLVSLHGPAAQGQAQSRGNPGRLVV